MSYEPNERPLLNDVGVLRKRLLRPSVLSSTTNVLLAKPTEWVWVMATTFTTHQKPVYANLPLILSFKLSLKNKNVIPCPSPCKDCGPPGLNILAL